MGVDLRRVGVLLAMTLGGLTAAPSLAMAGFGPPGGPTSAPFWQCPAVGKSTSCSFLIELTGDHNHPSTKVLADPTQEFYDAGMDDEIVAVQNDTDGPIAKIHLGVAGSGDNLFGFEGDGLCSPGVGAKPTGCPFGGSANTSDPFDYYGADMSFEPGYTSDDGVVDFAPALQPGQYTFFGLDAPCSDVTCDVEIAAGNLNDVLTSALSDVSNPGNAGAHLSRSAPGDFTDQGTLKGTNAGNAAGTVSYKLYKDPTCTQLVADATPAAAHFSGGAFNMPASNPVGAALANNATYYWQVTFASDNSTDASLDTYNTDSTSACGGETMAFGTPPARATTGLDTTLSGGGHSGAFLAVATGTPVTDSASVTNNGAVDRTATGTVTYGAYSDSSCSQQVANAFPLHGDIRQVTAGSAAASAAVTLPLGTYYFRAVYSGDSNHAAAAGACGAEVLAVDHPASVAAAKAKVANFAIINRLTSSAAGTLLVSGQVSNAGAVLSRAARCRRGAVRVHGRCRSSSFGTAHVTVLAAGTYIVRLAPNAAARRALKKGRTLHVIETITFRPKDGLTPATRTLRVTVKGARRRNRH